MKFSPFRVRYTGNIYIWYLYGEDMKDDFQQLLLTTEI